MVGIGVIGCGSRIGHVLRWLLERNKLCKIVAITDPSKESIEKYLDSFGKEIKVYKNHKSLVEDSKVDWVFIGSWNSVHKEHIISAFNSGKNVFCEKPLATSFKDCFEIKKKYSKGKNLFLISFPLRYSPHYNRIYQMIREGKVGKIISMEFNEVLKFTHGGSIMTNWRALEKYSGGHLLEKCCHDLDVANRIVGSVPLRVGSFGGLDGFIKKNSYLYPSLKKEKKLIGRSSYNSAFNPYDSKKNIVDNQVAIIEYANGVRATFHTNCGSGIPERRIFICGTEGTIRADVLTGEIELRRMGEKKVKFYDKKNSGGHGGGDRYLVKVLSESINQNKEVIPGAMRDAISSVVAALGIEKSRKEKKFIELSSFWKKLGIRI